MEPKRFADIATFVSVVRHGSFTAAAASMKLTRSALGKSVSRLEESMGVRLLNRTTRSISLTDEGSVVFERWAHVLEELEDVDAAVASRRREPTGTLKITAPVALGQRHVVPVINAFLRKWPNVRTELSLTPRFTDLIEEGFDIAIRVGHPKTNSEVLTRTVGWQQYMVCAAPSYLAARGTPTSPKELGAHDSIFFHSAGHALAWKLQDQGEQVVYEGPGRFMADNAEAIRNAVLSGAGLAYLPSYVVGADLISGQVIEVLEVFRPKPEPIRLMYPSKKYLSPRIRAFIDMFAAHTGASESLQ
ncbi:LysR family transcriptional regulator [Burkholderia cepacia]|nr:LysR family transcriptional regulator [Burkholderia cepacia]